MKDLKASDVMVRPVVAARKNAPVRDVVFQFLNGFYSGMPVTDDEGSVIGVITELDILEAVLAGKELVKITAGDIMTPKPATVDVDTPLTDVVKLMKGKKHHSFAGYGRGKVGGDRCPLRYPYHTYRAGICDLHVAVVLALQGEVRSPKELLNVL
jgi:CBS domain-containing protein